MRNRYYDPATGQFLNRDPLVSTTGQPYAYVGDDPLNATDPSGLYLGEGLVHTAEDVGKAAVRTVAKVAAVPPYFAYYAIYRTQSSIGGTYPSRSTT